MTVRFDPAREFKNDYEVRAHFYRLKGCNSVLRNILEIKKINLGEDVQPQAIVIMMNPGSAISLEDDSSIEIFRNEIGTVEWAESCLKRLVRTKPDLAQYQIMRLMRMQNWSFVRVLNLCDLKEAKSSLVESLLKEQTETSKFFSITCDKRRNEFAHFITGDLPIIAGWGRLPILSPSADECVNFLNKNNKKTVGVKYENEDDPHLFKYPSPMRKSLKIAWLDQISKLI